MDRHTQSIALEKQHVHDVYERIAPHFNNTHYKAWPRVKEFLLALEPGSIVADVGCGYGKYLGINKNIYKIGSDCSPTLVNIARCDSHEAMVCDNICLPFRDNSFDAVISIAVIHHFATTERRVQALNELARICRPGGQIMIYVWAMEQKLRKFDAQDVLVPWHLQPRNTKLKEQKFSTSSFSGVTHSGPARVPFIPSKQSSQGLGRSAKPGSRHSKELLRTNSDQGFDPLAYAEKNHFKRILLPTRSDSLDEVFLNISTEKGCISCQEVNLNEIPKHKLQAVHTSVGDRRKTLQKTFSFGGLLPKEDTESSLIGNLTSTSAHVSHTASKQLSLQKRPSENEVEGVKVDFATRNERVILKESDQAILCTQTENCILSMCHENNGVKNGFSQENGRIRRKHSAIDTLTNSNTHFCNYLISNNAPCYKSQASSRRIADDGKACEPFSNGGKTYDPNDWLQLKPFQNSQPIIRINSLTAQGELYNKARLSQCTPNMSSNPDPGCSNGAACTSCNNGTAIPVEISDREETPFPNLGRQSHQETIPAMNSSWQAKPLCSHCNHEVDDKSGGRTCCQVCSEEKYSLSLATRKDFDPLVKSTSDLQIEDQASHIELANCSTSKGTKTPNSSVHKHEPLISTAVAANSREPSDSQVSVNLSASKNGCMNKAGNHKNEDPSLYLRYYHVFREGELIDLIEEHVDSLHILRSYYDHANWCVIAEKVQVWTI